MITVRLSVLAAIAAISISASGRKEPRLNYTVTVDPRDLTSIYVHMQVEGAPRSFRIAMAVHPEYNDRYWRYIRDLRADGMDKRVVLSQDRENAWRIISHAGYANIDYRIELPREDPANRAAWHTALRPDGGSINPVDLFLYLPDFPNAPVRLSLTLPSQRVVVGYQGRNSVVLTSGGAQWQEFETDATTLLDSPILYGDSLRYWWFSIDSVPHSIVYWPLPNPTPFDTTQFVDAIRKVATEAVKVFGRPPYPHYTFLLEDGAWGALEHRSSVTIGMPSKDLTADPRAYLGELAHEFFHAWNLMRLYPEGRGRLSDRDPEHSTGLWLSEGVTIYYAELLPRRAGFPERGLSRSDLLAEEIEAYLRNPGNLRISPEVASARAVDSTGINGDYEPNYYAQGRLIGTALDIVIRDSTRGARGLDDLMRSLYSAFAMKRGFTTDDVERTASGVCECNLGRFFDDHVRNPRPLDFNRYISSMGMRVVVDSVPAADTAGNPLPDMRVWAYPANRVGPMRIWIQDPSSAWGRAGLHTGDGIVSFNGVRVDSFPDFRRAVRGVRFGTAVPVVVTRRGKPITMNVPVRGYDRVRVRIVERADATPGQIDRRKRWLSGE